MQLRDRVIVITGGGSGIGAALARRFAADSAAALILADIDLEGASAVAASIGEIATARSCDVANGAAVVELITSTVRDHGRIDLFCSNAGIATGQGVDATDASWQRIWDINLMANVHAARALLPLARPDAPVHLMITASAAGLLTNLGDAPYTATKHAAVGLAEWLAVTHGEAGLIVSCLCPQGVRTPLVMSGLAGDQLAANVVEAMGLIEPEQCAEAVVEALADERFLILPHPEVARYQQAKSSDPDRWIATMQKLQRASSAVADTSGVADLSGLADEALPVALFQLRATTPVGASVPVRFARRHDPRLDLVIEGAGFELVATRGTRVELTRLRRLADSVGPGMRLLMIGLNPSLHSADSGIGYFRAGNRFWPAALAAGVVTRDRDPLHALEHHGMGMTDLVKRPTPRVDAVEAAEFAAGLERVEKLSGWLAPGALCIVGLTGWRAAVDRKAVAGWQDRRVGGRPVYLMPSTSGLNAHAQIPVLVEHFRAATGPVRG